MSVKLKKSRKRRTYKLKPYRWVQPSKSVIPLHIYQMWHDLREMPTCVKDSIRLLKEQNPEFEHHLYDETMARKFIQDHFSKEVVDAYDAVIPHALKADLWRYCVIYKNGGVYLDSKYYGINHFKLIYLTDKEYFCKDIPWALEGVYNAILICKPKNPILLKTIKTFVKHTKEKYYGSTECCIGPLMLKQFFTENQYKQFELSHELINRSTKFINYKGYRILRYHKDYHKNKAQGDHHWIQYWRNNKIYN